MISADNFTSPDPCNFIDLESFINSVSSLSIGSNTHYRCSLHNSCTDICLQQINECAKFCITFLAKDFDA